MHSDGYPLDLTAIPEVAAQTMDNVFIDMCETYGVDFINDVYSGMTDFRNDMGECIAACLTDVPMEKQRVVSACDDILLTATATLTFCESDEEFDAAAEEVLAELRSTGVDEVFTWFEGIWNPIKDAFNSTREANLATIGLEMYTVE